MFIPCTSFSFARIFSKQSLRNSKFCTFLEKWGANEGTKKIPFSGGQTRSSFHIGVLESVYIKTQNPVLCFESLCKLDKKSLHFP